MHGVPIHRCSLLDADALTVRQYSASLASVAASGQIPEAPALAAISARQAGYGMLVRMAVCSYSCRLKTCKAYTSIPQSQAGSSGT